MSDLVVGDFHGYRAWRVESDGLLRPVTYHGVPWTAATVTADCRLNDDHAAPKPECSCGLYAFYRASTVQPDGVFGVVSVAGRVILATRGMKAERMTILALVTDDEALGRRYGVPIYPSRQALLSDYPPQDYSELVDVDPTDVPVVPTVSFTMSINTSGFAQSMQIAADRMKALAAQMGVTARQAGDALSALGDAWVSPDPEPPRTRAEIMADALDARRNRNTGPAQRRLNGRRPRP